MGLHISRSVSIVSTLRQRVDGFVNSAIRSHGTHAELCERMRIEVYETKDYQRLPEWAKHDVQGYYHGKSDMVGRFLTVFAYRIEGKLYRTSLDKHSDWPEWGFTPETNPSNASESGYYWPNGKPYFVSLCVKG